MRSLFEYLEETLTPTQLQSIYCDGGNIGPNPSSIGGTWAWVLVGEDGEALASNSGIVRPRDIGLPTVSNNVTELLAFVEALESMESDWEGTVHTDSKITLTRMVGQNRSLAMGGVPENLVDRVMKLRGGIWKGSLVAGHPTSEELAQGHRGGVPVSKWNVWCDEECNRLSREFIS